MSGFLSDPELTKLRRLLAPPRRPAPPPSTAPPPGGQVGKYRLLRMLGPQTWEASDGKRPNSLVLRIVGATENPAVVAAVGGDLRPLVALQHPVIITYHKLSRVGSGYFTVRDYVGGDSLEGRTLDPLKALHVFYEVARAIEYTHARGLVHGSLTPSNVILNPSGRPFVVDFAGSHIRARFRHGMRPSRDPQEDVTALQALFMTLLAVEAQRLHPVHPDVDGLLANIAAASYPSAAIMAEDIGQVLQRLPSAASASSTTVGLLERYKVGVSRPA